PRLSQSFGKRNAETVFCIPATGGINHDVDLQFTRRDHFNVNFCLCELLEEYRSDLSVTAQSDTTDAEFRDAIGATDITHRMPLANGFSNIQRHLEVGL